MASTVSSQYFLHIGKTNRTWTYRVSSHGRMYTLLEFCDKLGLRYNSVAIAIRRKNLMTGMHQKPFIDILASMVRRKNRGLVKCPCCVGAGRIRVKLNPFGTGPLKPVANLTWVNQDGSDVIWAKTLPAASDQPAVDSPEETPAA